MIERTERGTLKINTLDLEIFLEDLFENCESEEETQWLYETIESCAANTKEERDEQIEEEDSD